MLICDHLFVYCQQLGPKINIASEQIEEKWLDLALPKEQFDDIMKVGNFSARFEWNKFLALVPSVLEDVYECEVLKCFLETSSSSSCEMLTYIHLLAFRNSLSHVWSFLQFQVMPERFFQLISKSFLASFWLWVQSMEFVLWKLYYR